MAHGIVSCPHGLRSPPLILRNPQESLSPNDQGDAPKEARTRAPPKQCRRWEPGNFLHTSTAKNPQKNSHLTLSIVHSVYRSVCLSNWQVVLSFLLFFYPSIYRSINHVPLHKKRNINLGSVNWGNRLLPFLWIIYQERVRNILKHVKCVNIRGVCMCVNVGGCLLDVSIIKPVWTDRSDPNLFAVCFRAVVNTKLQ